MLKNPALVKVNMQEVVILYIDEQMISHIHPPNRSQYPLSHSQTIDTSYRQVSLSLNQK